MVCIYAVKPSDEGKQPETGDPPKPWMCSRAKHSNHGLRNTSKTTNRMKPKGVLPLNFTGEHAIFPAVGHTKELHAQDSSPQLSPPQKPVTSTMMTTPFTNFKQHQTCTISHDKREEDAVWRQIISNAIKWNNNVTQKSSKSTMRCGHQSNQQCGCVYARMQHVVRWLKTNRQWACRRELLSERKTGFYKRFPSEHWIVIG